MCVLFSPFLFYTQLQTYCQTTNNIKNEGHNIPFLLYTPYPLSCCVGWRKRERVECVESSLYLSLNVHNVENQFDNDGLLRLEIGGGRVQSGYQFGVQGAHVERTKARTVAARFVRDLRKAREKENDKVRDKTNSKGKLKIGEAYVVHVQRRPNADLPFAAGRQQIEKRTERRRHTARNLLGKLGQVDRVFVVIRFVVRLQTKIRTQKLKTIIEK